MIDIYRAVLTGKKKSLCKDYADYMRINDKYFAFALSDGASGAVFSDIGAKRNAEGFFNYLRYYSNEDVMTMRDEKIAEDVILFCKKSISDAASRINAEDVDFSATFIGAVVSEDEIAILHLGDGVVCGLTKDGKTIRLSEPDNLFGISNRTRFTVDESADRHLRITRIDRNEFEAFFMASDGVFEDLRGEAACLEGAENIFKQLESGEICDSFSLSAAIDRDNRDDHSMILVHFKEK